MMTVGQTVRWVGTTALGALIGWSVIQAVQKTKEEEDLPEPYKDDDVKKSNLSPRQALMRANTIYTAMKGAGTDEEAIYRAFNLVNADGLRLIYNKFGVRDDEDMGQWFIGDLSADEMKIVRAIWQNRGVKPPF